MNIVFRHYHIDVLTVLLHGGHTTVIAGMLYLPLRVVLTFFILFFICTKMTVTSTLSRHS